MSSERYVVLGLARPRAAWFSEISRWATAGVLPVEFVKCLTIDETRARLASGRRWSALLVDATVHGADRDLLDAARAVGAAGLVIADDRVDRAWDQIGATAVLPATFDRDLLLGALVEHARPVSRSTPRPVDDPAKGPTPWRGRLVAVTGPGGTGASTVAGMLAQGFGSDVREQGLVLLADLALHADQAVIHDAGDVVPGLPELIDAHRLGRPEPDDVRALTFRAEARHYDLLLGLRRHRDWTTLRPRAVGASVDGLRAAYRVVIADIDPDLEGERETGSSDVEERNVLARSTALEADLTIAVGAPGTVGVHTLARLVRHLVDTGVRAERILPVVNRGSRSARSRAETAQALSRLTGTSCNGMATPITLTDRRRLEDQIRAASRWPESHVKVLHRAACALLDRPAAAREAARPQRVVPGSLGHYTDLDLGEDLA